jgi:hypothetical protein
MQHRTATMLLFLLLPLQYGKSSKQKTTLDELVNFKGKIPTEENIEDKSTMEQLKLIHEFNPEEKQ